MDYSLDFEFNLMNLNKDSWGGRRCTSTPKPGYDCPDDLDWSLSAIQLDRNGSDMNKTLNPFDGCYNFRNARNEPWIPFGRQKSTMQDVNTPNYNPLVNRPNKEEKLNQANTYYIWYPVFYGGDGVISQLPPLNPQALVYSAWTPSPSAFIPAEYVSGSITHYVYDILTGSWYTTTHAILAPVAPI